VLEDDEDHLRFLVHPELHMVVADNELSYLESLLKDFLERANQQDAALFKQLSSLEVGPLVTHKVGTDLKEHPALHFHSLEFLEL